MLRLLLLSALTFSVGAAAPWANAGTATIDGCSIGFSGVYKLGCWTQVRATITGTDTLETPRLQLIAPDGDGSPTVVTLSVDKSSGSTLVETLTRVGRRDAELRVRLLDGNTRIDQWSSVQSTNKPLRDIRATAPLLVWVSAAEEGRAIHDATRVAPADLPTNPLAYEGVNTLVIRSGEPGQPLDLSHASAAAISEWVRQGGRIVLLGGQGATKLIGADGPLSDLAPGELSEIVSLNSTGVIEDYADSDKAINAPPGERLAAVRLKNVTGQIELYAGGRATEMPLVVRSQYGFGEVTFVAFDAQSTVLRAWPGHEQLMSLLLQADLATRASGKRSSSQLVGRAFEDLSGAAYVQLGKRFIGVKSISILALVAAVAVYLALLGPGAYYFGLRVARRMQSAWLTFPVIALAVGVGAWWWGRAATGDQPRVNLMQLVDVDSVTGLERGFLWAQTFSPAADLYDLRCELISADPSANQPANGYLTWHGLPGNGLGGMQTSAESLLAGQVPYDMTPRMDGMRDVPINRRASKALTARWTVEGSARVLFNLSPSSSGLVNGVIANESELVLTEVRLIAKGWAWRLTDMAPGEAVSIDAGVVPARMRTVLMGDLSQPRGGSSSGLSPSSLGVGGLLTQMMFHRALNTNQNSLLPSRYQQACDLSHAVNAGRPILLASVKEPRARLMRDKEPLDPGADQRAIFYRFIGPTLEEN